MSWIENISERCGLPATEAERILRRRGIAADRPLRPARRLMVSRIAFSGEKRGSATGRFLFDWSPLAAGVWAVASHNNLVGKSSVLEVLLWCLRGQPKGLQDDVRSWLERVTVELSVDREHYVLDFTLKGGQPDGTLARVRPNGATDVLETFASDAAFATAQSRFMMDALDLEPVPAYQKSADGGKTVLHGWLALSGAMYFGGEHKLLLGEVQFGALSARMLQMYVGLPWARTVMQASTAKKDLEQETAQATRLATEAMHRAEEASARLERERDEAKARVAVASSEGASAERLSELATDLARLGVTVAELEGRLAQAEELFRALRRIADDDQRALRDLRENIVATRFFNGLRPTCCPRCDAAVPNIRIQREAETLSCSLCSEPIARDRAEDTNDALTEAEARSEASAAAADAAEDELAPLGASRIETRTDLERTRAALHAMVGGDAFQERRAAELALARIEGAMRERGDTPLAAAPPPDAALVQAAFHEAKAAFDTTRGSLLEALNVEILRLGLAFGILGLEAVSLDANARMRLQKGGEMTYFSKVTPGERLRLRIATVIALLRVGQEHGVGRHPGLLIVDSPGAEETSESDLASLLQELQRVTEETSGLQILIASANAPAVTAALGAERCRIAAPGDYLW